MPIEFSCSQCGKTLRTPDDSAGKKGRCPDCGSVMNIPQQSTAGTGGPDPLSGKSSADPLGLGPQGGGAPSPGRMPSGMPGGPAKPMPGKGPAASPYASPGATTHQRPNYASGPGGNKSDKVGLVLALGICSLIAGLVAMPGICCCLLGLPASAVALGCGIPAWIVGQSELKRYKTGELTGSGQGEIQAGWICGICGVALSILYGLLFVLSFFLNFAMAGADMMGGF